ncbi:MAG: ubiquinol-cytochrome c reductase iron-sulfur subunit [Candidatus Wallbacteria bacterium]|nr:ubiquinol-cytochrome c reductase iron-sulfur subunit [Candidatus Wallbacteria bacterium]
MNRVGTESGALEDVSVSAADAGGGLPRRCMLLRLAAALQAATAAALGLPVVRFLLAPLRSRVAASEWQRLTASADVPLGATIALKYRIPEAEGYRQSAADTGTVWVARRPGRLDAFSAVCTHLGCNVAWEPARNVFACPCHGGLFSAAGQVVGGPPPRPLTQLEIKEEGGAIWVRSKGNRV